MDDGQKEQIAKNEALFRDINERVKEIDAKRGAALAEESEFLCECGHPDCIERISLTVAEYEAVRSVPTHFALVPGHEQTAVERVVGGDGERFLVVEKLPEEREIPRATNPRAAR